MADVFISYDSSDRGRVSPLAKAIEQRGWTVWWDRKLHAGATFDREIEAELDKARCIVVVWSRESVESDWVRSEATEGLERGILIPVLLDPIRPPLVFRRTQTIDLTTTTSSVGTLLDAIAHLCPVDTQFGRRASPLIGRDREMETLQRLLQRTERSEGGFTLLSGEAGVGKTRLAEETMSEAARSGFLVLTGRCEADAAPSYQPLLEQVEQARRQLSNEALLEVMGENAPELARLVPGLRMQFPDIPTLIELPVDQERHYLLRGCGEFLERISLTRPLLLVFEDLHWAGESTCRLLGFLAERLSRTRVMLMGTYRDTDLEMRSPFRSVLEELLKEHLVQEIPLTRLNHTQVMAMLEGRAGQRPPDGIVALIQNATEGNPFFIEELYRHLDDSGKLFDGTSCQPSTTG